MRNAEVEAGKPTCKHCGTSFMEPKGRSIHEGVCEKRRKKWGLQIAMKQYHVLPVVQLKTRTEQRHEAALKKIQEAEKGRAKLKEKLEEDPEFQPSVAIRQGGCWSEGKLCSKCKGCALCRARKCFGSCRQCFQCAKCSDAATRFLNM